MKKVGIFYGSTTGNTERIALTIQSKIGTDQADVYNIEEISPDKFMDYETIILGSSTWGYGELQDSWITFLPSIKEEHVKGKKIALFGLGDAQMYPDTFIDGVGLIYEELMNFDVNFIGQVELSGYQFDESKAIVSDMFVGLPIDEDNEGEQTETRIENWIKSYFI